MSKYLCNSFSLNMIPEGEIVVKINPIGKQDIPADVISAVGHQDTASLLSHELGFPVPMNRITLSLVEGDVLYVAQYNGPRLPEGTTELPEGANFSFMKIMAQENSCHACSGSTHDCCGWCSQSKFLAV